jgi:hypothetical protein
LVDVVFTIHSTTVEVVVVAGTDVVVGVDPEVAVVAPATVVLVDEGLGGGVV